VADEFLGLFREVPVDGQELDVAELHATARVVVGVVGGEE